MFTVTADLASTERVAKWLAEAKGQLPYAQMIAVNRTAEEILTGVRDHVSQAFTIRAPNFILPRNRLLREWRATKANPEAHVTLGEGGAKKLGERRRAILEPFEEGRAKHANRYGPVAIPTTYLRPNRANLLPRQAYPNFLIGQYDNAGNYQGLGRTARVATRTQKRLGTKKGQAVGRYFVLGQGGDRAWGLYERQPGGRIRKLWNFRPSVPRPARLRFYATAEHILNARWHTNFTEAVDVALRTAR